MNNEDYINKLVSMYDVQAREIYKRMLVAQLGEDPTCFPENNIDNCVDFVMNKLSVCDTYKNTLKFYLSPKEIKDLMEVFLPLENKMTQIRQSMEEEITKGVSSLKDEDLFDIITEGTEWEGTLHD